MIELLVASLQTSDPNDPAYAAARAALPPGVSDLGEDRGGRRMTFAGAPDAIHHAAMTILARWSAEQAGGEEAPGQAPRRPVARLQVMAPLRSGLAVAERVALAIQDDLAPSHEGIPAAADEAVAAARVSVTAGWLPLRVFIAAARPDVAPEALSVLAARLDERQGGGLRGLRARAAIQSGEAGIGITIRDPERVSLATALAAVRVAASAAGVDLGQGRFIGLVADQALVADLGERLGVQPPPDAQRLGALARPKTADAERSDIRPIAFVEAVASDKPTPGGGSVAALVGALAAALGVMVAGLTVGRPKFAAVESDMQRVRRRCGELKGQLLDLMLEDIEAFETVMASYRLPKATADDAEARRLAIQDSLIRAIEVPLEIMQRAMDVLRLSRVAAEAGNPNAVSDAGVSAYLAHAALQSAALNVDINILGLRNLDEGDRYRRQTLVLLRDARLLVDEVERIVRARMAG